MKEKDLSTEYKGFEGLVQLMKRLRGPDGCPWDREQDKESLKPYVIEEAYEVVEAIDNANPPELREELGDLLLQVVFLAQLAEEAGEFNIDNVVFEIIEKLVRRHPHVFGEASGLTAEEVVKNWASIKIDEKKEKGTYSALDGVPFQMPALLRAHRLTEKASRVGFDWDSIDGVFAKLEEELKEFEEAVASKERLKMEEELGDVIFSLVNVARFLEVNPEEALKKTISKFVSRFLYMEEAVKVRGGEIRDAGLEEMERLWGEAKAAEK